MPEPIRVGIIGANLDRSWAAAAHLPALAHLDEFAVTAVATTRLDTARAAADAFGVPHAFAGASELVAHPEVDLVVVAVKAPAHADPIRAALAAGKHVLSEWPLGVDLAEACSLAGTAAAAGVVHAVNLQGYHSPGVRFVRDLLADGRVGRVESISMITGGDPLGGSQIPTSLAWGADRAAANNVLTIMCGHALSVLDGIAGPLTEVSAVVESLHDQVVVAETGQLVTNDAPGQVAVLGRLVGGVVLSLSAHGGNASSPDGFTIKIAGTEGILTIAPADPGEYPHWGDWHVHVRSIDGTRTELSVPARYRSAPTGLPAGVATNVAALYRDIARAITEGRPAHPSFDTAVHHHRTLAAIEQAAQTGARQTVAVA